MKYLSRLLCLIVSLSVWMGAQAQTPSPSRGGTLTIALPTEPAHLNSAIDTTQQVKVVAGKIYNGLIKYDLFRMPCKPGPGEIIFQVIASAALAVVTAGAGAALAA